ncbi:MAG: PilZ domain-containing protein [Candidatus Omnitrophica bacterium]|nr:PilZ domain-containing protein [Candidatus Omnitrophota bacterium]
MTMDRRVNPRLAFEMEASFAAATELPRTLEATVVNISVGGFGFFTHEPVKSGRELLLCVELDQGEPATLCVQSVWCKAVGDQGRFLIGVRLLESGGADLERFLDFYTKLVKSSSPVASQLS